MRKTPGDGGGAIPLMVGGKNRAATLDITTNAERPWNSGKVALTAVSRNLGFQPLDGEENGSSAEDIEVVGAMRVFPDVFTGKDKVLSKSLLLTRRDIRCACRG